MHISNINKQTSNPLQHRSDVAKTRSSKSTIINETLITPKIEIPNKWPKIISAIELYKMDIPSTKFHIEGLLAEGLIILGGAPKYGKSMFGLQMGLKISSGGEFMGLKVNQTGVLYLALEDCWGRLQTRMNIMNSNKPPSPLFYYSIEGLTIENGLIDWLTKEVKEKPEIKIIIIDTFTRIRDSRKPGVGWYEYDYKSVNIIKEAMDKIGVSVILIHHTTKTKDTDDPFNNLTGTSGIVGAADTILILDKLSRGATQASLHVTGRDIDTEEHILCFNKEKCLWQYRGVAEEVEQKEKILAYQSSDIVKTIKVLLSESENNKWTGFGKNLIDAGKRIFDISLASSSRELSVELARLKDLLYQQDGIIFDSRSNGTGGQKIIFRR